jgi:hypothetical protein
MKKIRIISFALACMMLFCTFALSSSALTINFMPKTSNGKLYGIPAGSTAKTVSHAYYNTIVSVYDTSGNVVSAASDKKIGTGFRIKLNSAIYTAVVMGDVDGDGQIRARDYVAVKRAYLGTTSDLSALSKEALGISDNGRIRAAHYVMVKRAVMGTYDINQAYTCDPYDPGAEESGWTSGWV